MEQDDIHSPQTTVREALSFSGHLRLPKDQSKRDVESFVDQVRMSDGAHKDIGERLNKRCS